jgi:pimeloyl-ACP methyl ester carboxylesterase
LPANGHSADDFEPIAGRLAERHKVVALDWPGMGRSPAPEEPSAIVASSLADVVEDVVDGLGLRDLSLIGHSVGGFAAARLAIRRPEVVRALVLVDTGGFGDTGLVERIFCGIKGRPAVTRAIEARFARHHTGTRTPSARALVERIEASRQRPGYAEVVAAVWRSFVLPESSLRDHAGDIRAPTLVAWGADDPVIPLAVGRRVAESIAGAELVTFATGHSPFVDEPEAFVRAIMTFLDRADALAGARSGARPSATPPL